MKARTIVTLGLIALLALAAVCVNAAYDPNWKKSQTDAYSSHGLNERYVFGGSKGWIDNDSWDATSTEGTDCSDYAPRCLALPQYYGEHSNTGHPYNTDVFYNNPGSIPNIVTVANVDSLQAWDMWVYRVANGGPSDHMGLFVQYSGSNIITREAQCTACGVVSNTRPKQNLIDWNARYRRRADWGSELGSTGPDSVAWDSARIDVFVRGANNNLGQIVWRGSWSGWYDLGAPSGGIPLYDPAVCSRYVGHLNCYAIGSDNKLKSLQYIDGSGWSAWGDLGAPTGITFNSAPAAVATQDRMDVFVRGSNNHVWQRKWVPAGWGSWYDQGTPGTSCTSGPAVCSRVANVLDVFVRGTDNNIWQKTFDGTSWTGWTSIGGATCTSDPAVVAPQSDRMDVFVRRSDNHIWQRKWTPAGWGIWYDQGGNSTSSPSVSSRGTNQLDVFCKGTDDHLYQKYFDGTSWSAWTDKGTWF